jgi:putative flippase GtrA
MRKLISQFAGVGLVGLVGLVIDVSLFNLLRATALDPNRVAHGALWATLASTSVAIVCNWLGNRYWTFRRERRTHWWREGLEFALVSVGGLLIALGCVWFSEQVLDLHSVVSDNIAKNVVGLALGTIFRFTFYRVWVFRPSRPESPRFTLPEPAVRPDASVVE